MVKPELGTKRICVACGAKFYDLRRTPVTCPKCGAEQPAEQPKLRRGGGTAEDKVKLKRAAALEPALEDADLEVVVEDADDAVLEDAEDLEGEEDLGAEIEVEPGADDEER
ncbi:TIGR02300 family protein [Elioraea thermophila]|uniref:TIGR02300 family protein n=1 Tax=Elioraea thermophila TaxID=2185104 RepID=UPI000DF1F319|nr:TIGR02300 family protein [Elioraea thermophila]